MKIYILSYLLFYGLSSISQWYLISPAVSVDHSYKGVHFINQDTGFVFGTIAGNSKILRTTDGGMNWDTTLVSDITGTLLMSPYSMYFPNDTIGYLAGTWHLIKTIDGGDSWFEIDLLNTYENTSAAPDVLFINKDTGFVGWADGGSGCLRTLDGGNTWSPDPDLPSVRNFNDYGGNYFACTGGWAVLDLVTLTWQSYDNNITSFYHYVNTIIFNGRVIVIGDKMGGSSYGVYSYSDDMGATWIVQYVDPGRLRDIEFLNDTLWQMCGILDGTLRSYDSGETWHYTSVNNFGTGMYKWFLEFTFVNDSLGYAISQNGIYKTTNGGGSSLGDATFFPPNLELPEFSIEDRLSIVPNPVHDFLYFSNLSVDIHEIQVYSSDGRLVLKQNIVIQNYVDVSNLIPGIYFTKIITATGTFSCKIIKD